MNPEEHTETEINKTTETQINEITETEVIQIFTQMIEALDLMGGFD